MSHSYHRLCHSCGYGLAFGRGRATAALSSSRAHTLGRLPSSPDQHARPLVSHIVAFEAIGWHIVEVRPSRTDELALWRVVIERYDEGATMTVTDADPDTA